MDRSNKFVVFEGIDGVGKSTIMEGIKTRLEQAGVSVVSFQGLCEPFRLIRNEIRDVDNVAARYFFYIASNLALSAQVKDLLKTNWVLCDRYVYSTQAYHLARGFRSPINIGELDLVLPDFAFFVVVSDEASRQRRLKSRNLLSKDDQEVRTKGSVMDRIEQIYGTYNMVKIDNSAPDPLIAISEIWHTIVS